MVVVVVGSSRGNMGSRGSMESSHIVIVVISTHHRL